MGSPSVAYVLERAGRPLVRHDRPLPVPGAGEALVEVLACGLCHTDLAFADGSVPPRHPLPLVLGHEIVGRVLTTRGPRPEVAGRDVIVPAVLPCGRCAFCRAGRGNACPHQKMPGNDVHGGFASHLVVPADPLVPLDMLPPSVARRDLAVVADAVSTAYQAVHRSGLARGDAAWVVGSGGVGAFVVQIARARGARVAACDVRPDRLAVVAAHGAEATLDVSRITPAEVRGQLNELARDWGIPSIAVRIFECSGPPQGQSLAFGLLGRGSTLVQVGYTPRTVNLRLSNVMAYDATIHGTWGCPPERYADVLRLIADGEVVLGPFVGYAPMSDLNELLAAMAHHRLERRMVLDPLE
jgi:6-hydroxycyclohex-1-ene-1-carbonyl-CoA dehydrogenase